MDADAAKQLDRAYLQQLADQANSSAGVVIDLSDQVAERELSEIDVRTPALARVA